MWWLYAMKSSNAIVLPSSQPVVKPGAGTTQCSADAGYCFTCYPLSDSLITLNNFLFRGITSWISLADTQKVIIAYSLTVVSIKTVSISQAALLS